MSSIDPIRILLVDDHALFRRGVAQLIEGDPALALIGEAGSGAEGLARAAELDPDVVLLDLNMRDMHGLEVLEAMRARGQRARVVMLTVSDRKQDAIAALRLGASGYLLKDMEPEDLCASIRRIALGSLVLGASLTEEVVQSLIAEPPERPREYPNLTEREQEILVHLTAGRNNKEIAREMGISDSTVKVHIKHMLRKLRLRSRLEVVVWAHEHQGRH
jgi:two-component system nitrate/nitrite response regulator NarL